MAICMRKNAPTNVLVSKSFPGVIPPDLRYREEATPSRTLPHHGQRLCAGAQAPRMLRPLRINNPLENMGLLRACVKYVKYNTDFFSRARLLK